MSCMTFLRKRGIGKVRELTFVVEEKGNKIKCYLKDNLLGRRVRGESFSKIWHFLNKERYFRLKSVCELVERLSLELEGSRYVLTHGEFILSNWGENGVITLSIESFYEQVMRERGLYERKPPKSLNFNALDKCKSQT